MIECKLVIDKGLCLIPNTEKLELKLIIVFHIPETCSRTTQMNRKHTHSTHSSRHTYTEINLKEYLHPSKEGSRYSAVWFPGPRHHIWASGCVVKIYVKVLKDRASLRGEGCL